MAVALALLTSVLYGVSNYLGPTLSRTAPLYAVLMTGQSVALLTAIGLAVATGAVFPTDEHVGAALVAGLGNGIGLLAFYRAAQLGPLSIVTPIGSLGAIVPVTVGFATGDAGGALKIAGIALALTGVALATRRPAGDESPAGDRRRCVMWAAFSALCFGVFLAAIKPASEDGILWAVGLSRITVVGSYLIAAALLAQTLRAPLRTLPLLAIPGLLLFSGTLCYAAATQEGDLSVVSVVGSLFPVVTVGLALTLGGERLARAQAAGVAAAILGVVILGAR